MKFQSWARYAFQNNFDSPLWDFVKDEDNQNIVGEFMLKWTQCILPYKRARTSDHKNFLPEAIASIGYWFPLEVRDGEVYASWIFLVITQLMDIFTIKMQNYRLDRDLFERILVWWMLYEYYTIWPFGERLWDLLDEEFELTDKWQPHPFSRSLLEFRNRAVAFDLEPSSRKTYEAAVELESFYGKILANKSPDLTRSVLNSAEHNSILNDRLMKFDSDGIKTIKMAFPDMPEIAKWFRQTRLKRSTKVIPAALITAIVSCLYWKEELFFYFDPYYFHMWVCDRKHIDMKSDHPLVIFSFTNIVHSLFNKDALVKFFGEFSLDLSTMTVSQQTEVMKEMFDEVLAQLVGLKPDDFIITVEGKVNDTQRFDEVRKKVPYGKVWFETQEGYTNAVAFSIEKQLKKYRKKV